MAVQLQQTTGKVVGAAPGTLVHLGEKRIEEARISLMRYSPELCEEICLTDAGEAIAHREVGGIAWIDIEGLHDVHLIEKLGLDFGTHPLVLEDILNTGHRPKFEDHDSYFFVVLKMLFFDEEKAEIESEQVGLIVGDSFVLSFQEAPREIFNQVRLRIRRGKGRIRRMGTDYLAYALLDAIVDSYFLILEKIGDQIESLEEELINAPTSATLQKIHFLKKEMILLRKSIWPLRETLSSILRVESPLLTEGTRIFFQDVYDHAIHVADTVETFRDILSGMLDLYLSSISNRMNEVMKVLTIMATIFIPLSFLAGIYGMNFEHMPELKWRWGYASFWGLILAAGGSMICYFKRRGWL